MLRFASLRPKSFDSLARREGKQHPTILNQFVRVSCLSFLNQMHRGRNMTKGPSSIEIHILQIGPVLMFRFIDGR
jgi:hypothetical protein